MTSKQLSAAYHDPKASARLAGVTYVEEQGTGWSRTKKGKSFTYTDVHGKPINDPAKIERIHSLRIPPAWKDVWIAPSSRAHLQATGIDVKGTKQYLYHPKWTALREELKYKRLSVFAEQLPALRALIRTRLQEDSPTRERAVATALTLIDQLALRIGNEGYAEENATYGVTTLRDKHLSIHGDTIELNFIGKSHQEHSYTLKDTRLSKVLKEEKDIPGSRLFQYLDEEQKRHPLTSTEVNAFIKESTGDEFTAKDFRTWIATAEAYKCMKESCATLPDQITYAEYAKILKDIFKLVAEKLGNTVAVCKAHYVHAGLQKSFLSGSFAAHMRTQKSRRKKSGLAAHEVELASLLASL